LIERECDSGRAAEGGGITLPLQLIGHRFRGTVTPGEYDLSLAVLMSTPTFPLE